jgi:hypothetical protein
VLWCCGGAEVPHGYGIDGRLMEDGSLYHLLQDDDKAFSWLRRVKIMLDVSAGADYLHSNNIIHGIFKFECASGPMISSTQTFAISASL